METWQQRLKREATEMERGIRAALALATDEAVRVELERLAALPQFSAFTWLWAPALAKRNRVMFRPFILSYFDRNAVDASGGFYNAWTGASGAALQALLDEVDAADDVELTKRLYGWKLEQQRDSDKFWREDVVRRFRAASTPATRHVALAKVDRGSWPPLDPKTAIELWNIDAAAARKFILGHLPWGAERKDWQPLLDASRASDEEFHFDLYRRVVDQKRWHDDVLALPKTPDLVKQLERRHPATWNLTAAPTFYALLEKFGDPVIAYVKRHLSNVAPRWSWHGKTEGKGLPELLALAESRRWIDLWAALLRTSATRELFDAEVKKLVKAGNRARLEMLPGRGREMHGAGWSIAMTHALTDDTACMLYRKYPELARGPYRIHITPGWQEWFPQLVFALIHANDHELIDFMASRVAGEHWAKPVVDALRAHYERLGEADFVTHAAAALSRMPARGIWNYATLVAQNPLAKLLFERSTTKFLTDSAAVRDLLESPQIHVQLLAFRILGQEDPRAVTLAAEHVDLLQATLLRRLRAGSRKLAFAALRNAARHDEATARYLLGRMRDALSLPEKRYPVEELVGLIGAVLHVWPALRSAREQPVVYGGAA